MPFSEVVANDLVQHVMMTVVTLIRIRCGAHTSMVLCQTKLKLINALAPFSKIVGVQHVKMTVVIMTSIRLEAHTVMTLCQTKLKLINDWCLLLELWQMSFKTPSYGLQLGQLSVRLPDKSEPIYLLNIPYFDESENNVYIYFRGDQLCFISSVNVSETQSQSSPSLIIPVASKLINCNYPNLSSISFL